MTQDQGLRPEEIICMAQQAGIAHAAGIYMEHLERFAALVAAHEREACAKVCDEHGFYGAAPARDIRARSENGTA